jgi:fatty-acyl-CoA synthase
VRAHLGDELVAVARLADDLAAACAGRLARYKIPRYWKFVDSFPMTVSGKVRKVAMREIAAAELARPAPVAAA